MWKYIIDNLYTFQVAFSNKRTFFWFIIVIIGFCTRCDLLGDTSFIRSVGLLPTAYNGLNHFFHSSSISLTVLTNKWVELTMKIFDSFCVKMNGRFVIIGDGIKVSKEGKKMPGVKSLHQESQNNSKPEFIMGHSIQVLSLLVGRLESFFAVPLIGRIHEGLRFSNFKDKTLIDKMWGLISQYPKSYYVVLDAYYRNVAFIEKIVNAGSHIVVRLKSNAVAFELPAIKKKKTRGRPRKFGRQIKLINVFKNRIHEFKTVESPVYSEKNVKLKYFSMKLMIRACNKLFQIVWVIHPIRGRMILLTSDLNINPVNVIKLYGYRFKIEVSFKAMIQSIGTFAYHFWMKDMDPIKRKSKGQYLHRKDKRYRDKVIQKMNAYHLHIQVGFIAQGLMQYLSVVKMDDVWGSFKGYVRTIRKNILPSEMITGYALRESFSEFIESNDLDPTLSKFIASKMKKIKSAPRKDNQYSNHGVAS